MPADFKFSEDFSVTDDIKRQFEDDGFIIVRGLLDSEEISLLKTAVESDDGMLKQAFELNDGKDRKSKMCLWNHPGNDITGMVGRCEKVVTTSEKLLGGEVYHYHTKLMMKEAFTGGQFVWHQDYGYWYKNGCLFPDMLTAFIPVDRADRRNGCLQILKGSHKCGRIEHVMIGGQTGADLERVNVLKEKLDLMYVEMDPGDALFFHCNLLHRSDQNNSEFRRWAFLCAYNMASNDPVYVHHCPQYTPIKKVPNSAIRTCTTMTDMTGKDFMNPKDDKTIKVSKDKA
ncbi:L-proline trans-4-hydroxylase-like isoform X2 [Lineus longissimus]|uniref:L-proline trans-4-hydroxylase-like isoform X2 n=1 Tax=Lineus longissimus TaxID=88925 RepID=UPI002B4D507D